MFCIRGRFTGPAIKKSLANRAHICYDLLVIAVCGFFLDSSMAEHSAVNRRVVGSSPTRGAFLGFHSGPMVKRLRHRPFTAVTAVRICLGSLAGNRIASWIFSSVGQSSRLITDRSWVRVPEDPFISWPSGEVGYRAALSRRRSTVRARSGSLEETGRHEVPALSFKGLPVWRNWQTQGT